MTTEPPNPPGSPVPVGVWALVFLGTFLPLVICYLGNEPAEPQYHRQYVVSAICFAVIPSAGLTSGSILSCRLYGGWAARVLGTIVFGFLMMIATAAVVFAGCICTNNIYIH